MAMNLLLAVVSSTTLVRTVRHISWCGYVCSKDTVPRKDAGTRQPYWNMVLRLYSPLLWVQQSGVVGTPGEIPHNAE